MNVAISSIATYLASKVIAATALAAVGDATALLPEDSGNESWKVMTLEAPRRHRHHHNQQTKQQHHFRGFSTTRQPHAAAIG